MDPTAQNDPQNLNPQQPPNPIRPGQFVVAGEPPKNSQASSFKIPQPTSSPPPLPMSPNPTVTPPSQNQPASNPDDLLAAIAKENQGKAIPSQIPSQPQSPPPQLSPLPQTSVSPPPSPIINLAQEETAVPAQTLPPIQNTAPDPTPFVPPQAAPPSEQNSPGMDKIKLILIILGVMVLIALIAFLVWFFVINKSNKAAKTENDQDITIDEPSPLPKRTQGGFGTLPQSSSGATLDASPDTTPNPNDEITVPDLTGL